jgi:hypothetical protein
MEDDYTSRLHSVALSESESDESKKISDDKPIIEKKICCFKTNDENACLLCKCLDWCCCLITFQ